MCCLAVAKGHTLKTRNLRSKSRARLILTLLLQELFAVLGSIAVDSAVLKCVTKAQSHVEVSD
jgi:hypothetical protein